MLFNSVLRPKLLINPFASCFLINLDFLVPRIAHFDDSTALPFFVFKTLGFMFYVFFYTLNNKITLFYTCLFYLIIISSIPIFEIV